MSAVYDAIQELRKRYPDSLSAVMPALQLAQGEHGGWLPPEAFREVADALEIAHARLADQAEDLVSLLEEVLRQVRAVLACDSGDQRSF